MRQTKSLQGIQTHLAFLVRYNWRGEVARPSAMAVRTQEEIIDYVKQILEIRQRAQREHWSTYLEAEQRLLELSQGRLPAAIRLRSSYAYRTSPKVKVLEMEYADKHADYPSTVIRNFEQETGYGIAAFEEKLDEWEIERWRDAQDREAAWHAKMEKLAEEQKSR
jgi:hypothetical protein